MGQTAYEVVIASPAKIRYHQSILPYLYSSFSAERAAEIEEKIINSTSTLKENPKRGRREDYLRRLKEDFRFILYKETSDFELKIIYHVDEARRMVYVTDFFPTRMDPMNIAENL